MYQVKASSPKDINAQPLVETATTHAAAVAAMVRLMKDFGTVEIERASRLGFRHTSVR